MDKKLIAQASENLQLKNICLHEASLKRFEIFKEQEDLGQQVKLKIRTNKTRSLDSPIFQVFIDFGVRVIRLAMSSESKPIPLFQIEATYQVDYELKGNIEDKALKEFAHYNAVHNTWPFWRQYVFSVANQANLPCPEIPLRSRIQ